MMKKLLTTLIFLAVATPTVFCGRGGDAALGGFAGSMMGSVIGSAITSDSGHRKSRTDEKIEQVQREQDQSKVSQLQREMDKKELENKLEQQRLMTLQNEREKSGSLLYILLGIILFMLFAVIGLGVLLVHMRKKN